MRFTEHDDAGGDALSGDELRAARGDHDLVMEDEDCAPVLAALCPWLQLHPSGEEYVLAFAVAADISLRFMQLQDPAACLHPQVFRMPALR